MARIMAVVLVAFALAGCVFQSGNGYPQTVGPQGDTQGAVGG